MRARLARAMLALAAACLGESRRAWAEAMEGELEAAFEAGKPLAFAIGCLLAALRELPRHSEGRRLLANNAVVLGLLLPVAALQFVCAAGFFPALTEGRMAYDGPMPGSAQSLYLGGAYLAALPLLAGLWLWLSLLQLRLAWLLLDGDRSGMARTLSLMAAATVTLLILTGVLFLDDSRLLLQAGALSAELLAGSASAWRHARLDSAAGTARPA